LATPTSQKWVDAIAHLPLEKSACHNQFRQAHPERSAAPKVTC